MNKEFKKYYEDKLKDNTNKYVVMYKIILIFSVVLLISIGAIAVIDIFTDYKYEENGSMLAVALVSLFVPMFFLESKIYEEDKTKSISRCKTKKDIIILRLYYIITTLLLIDTFLLIFVFCILIGMFELFSYSPLVGKIYGYSSIMIWALWVIDYKYLVDHKIKKGKML